MEIEIVSLDDSLARFILTGARQGFANTFRRAMISEVPTLAIEDVRIYDNTSALFDEMLAHRLGLIPLKTDLDTYSRHGTCSCGGIGCSLCTVTYRLSVEEPRMVYSGDLIPDDPTATPVHLDIPLVKLIEGQKLVIEAKAVVNSGRVHAKWQPTLACGYKNYPVITVSDTCDTCSFCVSECPQKILTIRGKKVSVIKDGLPLCTLCKLCEQACLDSGIGDEPAIKISTEPERFIFVVESDGSLPAGEIMVRALGFIRDQADELERELDILSGEEER